MPYFDPALQLELIEAERGTLLIGAPTMLIAMLEHPDFARDLSSVRSAVCGAATAVPELVRRVEAALNIPLSIMFGQTEAACITQTRLDDTPEDRANSLGQALPRTEVKIVDPASGEAVRCGVVGELCTRGYHVMHGYFDNLEGTAAAIDAEGWLRTGDLCSMDERGYCYIEGRLKDMIIRGARTSTRVRSSTCCARILPWRMSRSLAYPTRRGRTGGGVRPTCGRAFTDFR
jgi:fatty-acyl-CoA synthase